jgi:tetratricopeptide (TPR) repeat protein
MTKSNIIGSWKNKTLFIILIGSLSLNLGTSEASDREALKLHQSPSSKTLRSMARVYMAYGEYEKAKPLLEQALTMAKTNHDPDSELAMCLIDLATLHKNQNDLTKAKEMCELGLKLQEKVLDKNHPYVAQTLRILSSIYKEQGIYDQAEANLDRAATIMLVSSKENDKAMIPFYVDKASLLVAKNDLVQAESYYNKAMPLINKSYGPNHLYTANVLASMAELYELQGKYASAQELNKRSSIIKERIYGPNHNFSKTIQLGKATISQNKGSHATEKNFTNQASLAEEQTMGIHALTGSTARSI